MLFADRADAGRRLAERLERFRGGDAVVLGLPRGGVQVAFEVARHLRAPLDVIVVRKLGVPFQPELAFGAIGEAGVRVLDTEVVRSAKLTATEIEKVERAERAELRRRVERFRAGRPPVSLAGRTALIVDDGIATGSTARAACQVARALGAARVVVAVPVGAPDAIVAVGDEADEIVWLEAPSWFYAVGQWYRDFPQTSDREVAELLHRADRAATEASGSAQPADPAVPAEDVEVFAGPVPLAGQLAVPEWPTGLVIFAHGSGSSRHSPRNRYVATVLHRSGLATLLFDLLTRNEELNRAHVFDIAMLAGRLVQVTQWIAAQPETANLPLGYFGASTGAAAALWAATDPRVEIGAVVSRGGRPDLARERLASVLTPTLLIVGEHDEVVLDLNYRAQKAMPCESELAVVPGATHLFGEPGALDRVAELARDWFRVHLTPAPG